MSSSGNSAIPKWWVSSLNFILSEKTAGWTFFLESNLTLRSLRLDTSMSRLDPKTNQQLDMIIPFYKCIITKHSMSSTWHNLTYQEYNLVWLWENTEWQQILNHRRKPQSSVLLAVKMYVYSREKTTMRLLPVNLPHRVSFLSTGIWIIHVDQDVLLPWLFQVVCSLISTLVLQLFELTEVRQWDLLSEKWCQAAVDWGCVHVSILVGDQQGGLGLHLKQICTGLHEGLLHIPVKVTLFWFYISANQTHTQ